MKNLKICELMTKEDQNGLRERNMSQENED
jgi:hypothetical protein